MALFELGAAKRRKARLTRIETALGLARRELEAIRYHQSLIMRLIGGYDGQDAEHEWLTDAFSRANGYLAIASENVMVGLQKSPFPQLRPYDPPLDPRDEGIGRFFEEFRRHHYGTATRSTSKGRRTPPATIEVFVLDGELRLLGTLPTTPVGDLLDEYEGYTFIPAAGPLDADERESLTHAIWGAGLNLPVDHVPDDETLQWHARLTVEHLFRRGPQCGSPPETAGAPMRSVHANRQPTMSVSDRGKR